MSLVAFPDDAHNSFGSGKSMARMLVTGKQIASYPTRQVAAYQTSKRQFIHWVITLVLEMASGQLPRCKTLLIAGVIQSLPKVTREYLPRLGKCSLTTLLPNW